MTATPSSSDLSSGAQSAWLMLAVGTPARYSRVPDALSPRLHRAVVTPPCVCGGRGRTIRVHHRVQRREKGGSMVGLVPCFFVQPPLARSDVDVGCPHPIPWCALGVLGSAPAGMCGTVPVTSHARGSYCRGLREHGAQEESEMQGDLGAPPTSCPV